MKNTRCILFGIITLCIISSCSNHQNWSDDLKHRRTQSDSLSAPAIDDYNNPYETLVVTDYVQNHPDLFDNDVLIFQSMEDVDSLLEEMQNMNYEDLRSQYTALGHNNSNIENCILLDSLYYVISQYLGYTSDQELEDYQKAILDSLVYCEVMQINPSLLYSYTITDTDQSYENDNNTYDVIEPYEQLDITALLNSNRLCIIETNVVKLLLDSTLIITPLLNYHHIADYESLGELELLDANNASSLTDTTAIIWQPLYENNMLRSSTQKSYKDINYIYGNWYMMTINYKMTRLYNLFVSGGDYNLCANLTIKNYKKGCFNKYWLSRHDTNGEVFSETYIETNSMQGYANKQHYFYIDSKFATYIRYKSANVFVGFFRPYYEISYIHVSLTNGRNIIDAGDPDIRNHQ